jgi:CheY-like chemotaxis protein
MTKRVLDVGNCSPDHNVIRRFIERHFNAVVVQAHNGADTVATLQRQTIDLVLVNRKLDQDYSDGLRVIERIKNSAHLAHVPVMLVTNYEEHQQQAMQAGAERGFGKLSMEEPETLERLSRFLT